jgi:hypothetical protein
VKWKHREYETHRCDGLLSRISGAADGARCNRLPQQRFGGNIHDKYHQRLCARDNIKRMAWIKCESEN